MKSPKDILQQYWGFEDLRPAQAKVIEAILEGKDALALLPTGGGKSMCFQIPGLLKEGITIVISPLIALMQDQVSALQKRGIKATMINSGIAYNDLDKLLDNCIYGNYKFLYLSPERLQQELVQSRIQQMPVNLIAIDEAHCISEWGHDFRPSYTQLSILRELHTETPLIALTATATKRVVADIKEHLQLKNTEVVKSSFQRTNIAFLTLKCEDKHQRLLQFLQKNKGVSIVYVRSRKATIELKELLNQHQISAEAFHGGISTEEKNKLLERWLKEEFLIMVATSAFGMGINKANVRNVVHFNLPESIESYYQEAGRAGRDDKASKALLLYNDADASRLKKQFLHVLPTPKTVKHIYKKINAYFSIAYGEGQETKHNFNFYDFCQTYGLNSQVTYNTLQLLDRASVLMLSKEFHQQTELRFTITNQHLHYFLEQNPKFRLTAQTLLRMQGGFFEYKHPINLDQLSHKTNISKNETLKLLKSMAQQEIIELSISQHDTNISFLVPREDDTTINPLVTYIKQQYRNKEEKVNAVIAYIENNEVCKQQQILSYFGENNTEVCGKCSVCLQQKKSNKVSNEELKLIYNTIVTELQQGNLSSKILVAKLNFKEEHILTVLRLMLDKNLLNVDEQGLYKIK